MSVNHTARTIHHHHHHNNHHSQMLLYCTLSQLYQVYCPIGVVCNHSGLMYIITLTSWWISLFSWLTSLLFDCEGNLLWCHFMGYSDLTLASDSSLLIILSLLSSFLLVLALEKTLRFSLIGAIPLGVYKVALQFYWNHTSAWVFSCQSAAYFLNTFF